MADTRKTPQGQQAGPDRAAPEPGPQPSAAPPGQGSPDAAATSGQAAAPPAEHAAAPPGSGQATVPGDPGTAKPAAQPAGPGGDTTAGDLTARGGRLADVAAPDRIPEGVPYAVAREALYVGHPEAAAAPVRAFNAGDRVPAELVEKFGWHDLVQVPEWASAPPAPANENSEEQN